MPAWIIGAAVDRGPLHRTQEPERHQLQVHN
jgi:hypothetical protein